MASSANDKRAAFIQRIKVNPSQTKSAKQSQFSSNNKSSSNSSGNSDKASAPVRGKALGGGRGNER
jgi:hypothetical protein